MTTEPGTQGGTEMSAAPGTEGGTVPPPARDSAALVPLTLAERAALAVRSHRDRAARIAAELLAPFARLAHTLTHPESWAGHRAYVKSRAWIHPETSEGAEKALAIAGIAYHAVIAWPVMAAADSVVTAAKTVKSCAQRPLRFLGLIAFVTPLTLILLYL